MPGGNTRKTAVGARRGQRSADPLDKFWDMKSFLALSDAEKEEVWESLNREIPFKETRPLSPEQRRQWARMKRAARGNRSAKAAKVISVSIEGGLLERADAYARKNRLTRSQLVARGLKLAMAG
jgi:hypothetical protein